MVSRGTPFDELERLLDRMNEARERAGGGVAVDVRNDDEAFVVTADLPGFDREDIDVEIHDRTLRIDATRQEETETGDDGDYIRRERSERSLSRSVTLPEDVDEESAAASFENGVLTVELPKEYAQGESTRVEIE